MDEWVGAWVSEWISERCRAARNDVQWNLYFSEHQNKISARHCPCCTQQLTIYFSMAQQPLVDLVLFIIKASLSHSDIPHSIGLLWMSDQLDAQTSTWQTTPTRDRHPFPWWDANPQFQLARGCRSESWTDNYICLCKNVSYQRIPINKNLGLTQSPSHLDKNIINIMNLYKKLNDMTQTSGNLLLQVWEERWAKEKVVTRIVHQSSPCPHTDILKIHFNSILPSTPRYTSQQHFYICCVFCL